MAPGINRHLLGRYVRQRGRRFELHCLSKLRQCDLSVRRTDETDRALGFDLWLPRAKVAVQCKCSLNPKDLMKGLDQLQHGLAPWDSRLLLCIHSLVRKPGDKGELSFAGCFPNKPGAIYTFPNWHSIISLITRLKNGCS